jgi:ADP-ribose diphosphatase
LTEPIPDYQLVGRYKWLELRIGPLDEPYVSCNDGVLIVPLDAESQVLFINEAAVTHGRPVLTLPGGAVDDGEDAAISADRELQEEIGYRAGRMDVLGELHPLARHGLWKVHVYLARDLIPSRLAGDERHTIEIERMPLAGFEDLIAARRLTDSTAIAALFLTRSLLAKAGLHV